MFMILLSKQQFQLRRYKFGISIDQYRIQRAWRTKIELCIPKIDRRLCVVDFINEIYYVFHIYVVLVQHARMEKGIHLALYLGVAVAVNFPKLLTTCYRPKQENNLSI